MSKTRTSARRWLPIVWLAAACVGCTGPRSEVPPDERFGHRYQDDGQTIAVTPPDSAVSYFYYPAPFDTVIVRPEPFAPAVPAAAQEVAVEVLVKGAFPDACSELHSIEQDRAGNIIIADLQMRRPQGAVCASVRRPYRFYVMLDGRYGIGNYTLKLNDQAEPFEIRAPEESAQ